MSNKCRCAVCNHRPGPRSTAVMARAGIVGNQKGTEHEEQPKKAPCAHECHEVAK